MINKALSQMKTETLNLEVFEMLVFMVYGDFP